MFRHLHCRPTPSSRTNPLHQGRSLVNFGDPTGPELNRRSSIRPPPPPCNASQEVTFRQRGDRLVPSSTTWGLLCILTRTRVPGFARPAPPPLRLRVGVKMAQHDFSDSSWFSRCAFRGTSRQVGSFLCGALAQRHRDGIGADGRQPDQPCSRRCTSGPGHTGGIAAHLLMAIPGAELVAHRRVGRPFSQHFECRLLGRALDDQRGLRGPGVLGSWPTISTLSQTLVYVTTTAGLVTAYNQATGMPVWSVNMGGSMVSSPLAEGNSLWVAMQHGGRIYKLDSATGSVECSASSPLISSINSSPALATPPGGKPTVYIGINDVGTQNGPVLAIDEATCDIDFSSHPEPGAGTGGVWSFISYAVDATGEPLVLFGTADPDSAVYAIDAVSGKLVWRYAVDNPPPGSYDVGAGVTISPPGVNGFADGVAYAHTKYGDAYASDLTTGALIWQYDFGSPSISTAALSGTNLVFGDGGGAIDLNAVTGALVWQSSGDSSTLTDGAPAIVGPAGSQIVGFGNLDGTFRVLSMATGAQLYGYQTGTYLSASVAETDGNLLLAGADGFVYDFAPGGGNPPAPTTSVTSPAPSVDHPQPERCTHHLGDGDLSHHHRSGRRGCTGERRGGAVVGLDQRDMGARAVSQQQHARSSRTVQHELVDDGTHHPRRGGTRGVRQRRGQ